MDVKLTNDNIYYVNKLTTSSGGQNVASMEISGDGGTKKLYMDSANGYRPHFNNGTTDYTLLHNGDFVNLNNGMDYVIESWQSGTSWYRLYKSGWLEQGGHVASTSTDMNFVSVTLYKPYTSNSITVVVGSMALGNVTASTNVQLFGQVSGITKTSIEIRVRSTTYQSCCRWVTFGYAA